MDIQERDIDKNQNSCGDRQQRQSDPRSDAGDLTQHLCFDVRNPE